MDVVQVVAENISKTRFEDLPAEAVEATKRSIMDTLGVMLAASTLGEGCREMVEIALDGGGKPESSVIAFGGKLPCWMAAFANGALSHPMDYDDTADAAKVHPTASTLPAALALAEREDKSGKDLITAVALGNDLVIRLGLCLSKSMAHYGWLFPQVLGTFGAAAASGKILGLSKEQMVSALGHALNQTAGSLEASLSTGSVSRGIRDAFTGKAGVISALLARKGVAGLQNVFQGQAGLFNLYFKGDYNPAPLTAELGKRFEGAYVSFKPWPSCRGTHPSIDAALSLALQHDIKPDDVKSIVLGVSARGDTQLAAEEKKKKPQLVIDAKIGLAFTVSLAIAKRNVTLSDFTPQAIQNPTVLQLAQKVSFKHVPEFDDAGIGPGDVEITCRDGKVFSKRVKFAYGHPDNPVSTNDLIGKFRDCATYCVRPLSSSAVEKAISSLTRLESAARVGQVTELLSGVAVK